MKLIAFLDHSIGYNCFAVLTALVEKGLFEVPFVVTTASNSQGWWPNIQSVNSSIPIKTFKEEDPDLLIEGIDLVFLISWKHVMPDSFVSHYSSIINLHYSLLPKFRGVYPVNWAIASGEEVTGVSFHLVNERIDQGDIILQKEVSIETQDNSYSLLLKLDEVALIGFEELIMNFVSGIQAKAIQQPENQEYYSRDRFNKLRHLSLDEEVQVGEFLNVLRALTFKQEGLAYFVDERGKRYSVSVSINEVE